MKYILDERYRLRGSVISSGDMDWIVMIGSIVVLAQALIRSW
jgi:hypothetical protein